MVFVHMLLVLKIQNVLFNGVSSRLVSLIKKETNS